MVFKKLDDEAAFNMYVSMDDKRSHNALARHFHVSKRAIGKAARRGNWTARLEQIEKDARAKSDKKLGETRAEVRERHLKMIRAMASRGVQALQTHQLADAMQGVKTVAEAIKLERLILGEATDRVATSIEEITRREVETFLATSDEPDDEEDD